ncbi:tyrosinase [Octopus bimaculoides]|uniref:Tyrosinase copper-binding domain-containing protein n=1 Tax=Octopus bimaculoides TaxID=37653 RepID=A0A0L8GQB8_OCTBM|nr:tyrosinase [Octopus bimaculoides]|eukprot:XP_014779110.1 PREDICTED: tyrosinase-like [Octopus bimaculoides]
MHRYLAMDIPQTFSCFLFFTLLPSISAQFPRVCAENATTPDGICCPTRPGDTLPCGGPLRGLCRPIDFTNEVDLVPPENKMDDRFNWPTRFFKQACDCRGNYDGFMCQHCDYGFTGLNCTKKLRRIRKDYRKLTKEEKDELLRGILLLSETDSDYAVLDTTASVDPAVNPTFVNVSVYNYLAYFHYYVARRTLVKPIEKCQTAAFVPDFAHGGPVFSSWHRAYLLLWEMEIARALKNPSFSFPYWNWTESGRNCDVCTNDFMGHTPDNKNGTLDTLSLFSEFSVYCVPTLGGCAGCNVSTPSGKIIRRPGNNPEYRSLPPLRDVEFLKAVKNYDTLPYDTRSGNNSFRNLLEGFANREGPTTGRMYTHNQVHAFMNGTFSELVTAAFDPVFQLHHAFVDKTLEIWIRENQPAYSELPVFEAPPGHGRMANMVPFFPVEKNFMMFAHSHALGYDYDDLVVEDVPKTSLSPVWIIVIVEAGLLLLLLAIIIELARTRNHRSQARQLSSTSVHNNVTADTADEEQPIFQPGNPTYRTYNAAENS